MAIPDGEAGVDLIELVAFEVQVFAHTRYIGIANVGSIELVTC